MRLVAEIKRSVLNNPFIFEMASALISFLGRNKIRGRKKNNIQFKGARLIRCQIRINGTNNTILIQQGCKLIGSTIQIRGNNNVVLIGNGCTLYGTTITVEDNVNQVTVGDRTVIYEKTELAATEGSKIIIGTQCLISSEVDMRTGDSHAILNREGERINWAKDIMIHNHTWIGTKATILKGPVLGENCVVATGAIVTKAYQEDGCVLAGVPAKIIEKGITWNETR